MQVEILYIAGCPNHRPAVVKVQQALEFDKLSAELREVEVADAAMARRVQFLGSPSIRVDGLDVEEEARNSHSFGFGCRSYAAMEGRTGLPALEVIRKALLEAATVAENAGL